ncbi:MAG: DNA polymerase III subunit gamma/tau, partial [Azospirillaceae bacterium]
MTDLPDAPASETPAAKAPAADAGAASAARGQEGYRVLARKYRPQTFSELIGQDALVRTLTNAIRSQRLAHAFVLTGVRGVGKTTTARIIAKALNCTGPDGAGGMTPEPCGVCEACRSIAADRHVDVMEMDAASRTGVDDIREIIDGVRYGPVSARYKVYIIDEVHMLSRNAFNALLKTLEEPPPHVKFVFATTEIRKVPVTVLSRCQRFDLPRVAQDLLVAHFTTIADKESATAEPEAIAMIARAADGSVRDGLSLLDQAVSQGFADGSGTVTADQVRRMLGLADRTRVLDLLDRTIRGDAPGALETLQEMHRLGADPLMVLQDLLDLTHFLTRAKLVPAILEDPALPEDERTRGAALAESVGVPVLTRCWQMLLKGLGEVQSAPTPDKALEMVIIRLLHAAHLPTPGDVVRKLEAGAYAELGTAALATAGPGAAGGGATGSGG